MTRIAKSCVSVVFGVVLFATAELFPADLPEPAPGAEAEAARYGERAMEVLKTIDSYRCDLIFRERHGGKLQRWEHTRYIFKKPGRVYMRWVEPGLYAGLQVSYIPERDGPDHFSALGEGFRSVVGVRRWANDSRFVRTNYRHHFPAKNTHIGFMIDHSVEVLADAKRKGLLTVLPPVRVANERIGLEMIRIECRFSDDPADGIPYGRVVMYFDDRNTGLPLHVQLYDHGDRLLGEYACQNFEANVEIAESQFTLRRQ